MKCVGRANPEHIEWLNHLRDRCDSSEKEDSQLRHVRQSNVSIQWRLARVPTALAVVGAAIFVSIVRSASSSQVQRVFDARALVYTTGSYKRGPGRINEPVLTAIQYTAATSFHGTAEPDIKHVPPMSCSETASVATAPHTIPQPSDYHRLAGGPFPPTDHQLPQSCWRGLSVAPKKIATLVYTQLHGVLPVADSVHTDVSEVVSLLTLVWLRTFWRCRRKREAVRWRGGLSSRMT